MSPAAAPVASAFSAPAPIAVVVRADVWVVVAAEPGDEGGDEECELPHPAAIATTNAESSAPIRGDMHACPRTPGLVMGTERGTIARTRSHRHGRRRTLQVMRVLAP